MYLHTLKWIHTNTQTHTHTHTHTSIASAQFGDCGGLKMPGHVRRYDLVVVDMALLEEVCHWVGLWDPPFSRILFGHGKSMCKVFVSLSFYFAVLKCVCVCVCLCTRAHAHLYMNYGMCILWYVFAVVCVWRSEEQLEEVAPSFYYVFWESISVGEA